MFSINYAPNLQQKDVINALIFYLMNPLPLSLEEVLLSKSQKLIIRLIYFLLNQKKEENFNYFVLDTLPRLLEQIHHTTIRKNVEYQGKIRGQVLWPATYKARLSQDYNPNLYHCRQVQLYFNTPENQLLKYLIETLQRDLKIIPPFIRNGFCFISTPKQQNIIAIISSLQIIENTLKQALKNIYLRQVESLHHISSLHLQKAENSRIEDYGQVAKLYQNYHQNMIQSDLYPFYREGQHFLLLPNQVTAETDIWIKAAAVCLKNYQLTLGETNNE
ncbi:MAG: DUF2357 domain-containing protein [Crocosphaera sp.]